jgi:hypothetical protein
MIIQRFILASMEMGGDQFSRLLKETYVCPITLMGHID